MPNKAAKKYFDDPLFKRVVAEVDSWPEWKKVGFLPTKDRPKEGSVSEHEKSQDKPMKKSIDDELNELFGLTSSGDPLQSSILPHREVF